MDIDDIRIRKPGYRPGQGIRFQFMPVNLDVHPTPCLEVMAYRGKRWNYRASIGGGNIITEINVWLILRKLHTMVIPTRMSGVDCSVKVYWNR